MLLYSEFLEGTGKPESEGMAYAYKVINKLYQDDKLGSKLEAYGYYSKNRTDFNWLDEMYIGHSQYCPKPEGLTASDIISEEAAKKIINKEFCFEIDKIEICGTPYYYATDFNYITFMVRGYARVFINGDLHDIYR
jgi:hypothetical protein